MHILLKIAKWLIVGVLTLLIILAAGSYILYSSADMKQPDLSVSDMQELPLSIADSLRSYGDNTLVLNRQGLWELYVKGTPFERGVAIGRISEDLLYYQEKVFVDEIKKIIPSEKYLKFLRYFLVIFNRNLGEQIPEENREEIYGISLSCTDEFDAIGTPYERQLNYHAAHDIGHMMQAYMLVGCSSFGVWGSESAGSTLIIGRNFDFFVGEEFAKNTSPCACGRNSIRLSPLVGRKGQLIKFKGTSLYPPALYDVLDNIPQVKDYIIDVYTNDLGTDEIVVRVGCEHPSEKFEKELKDLFRSRVRVAPTIQFASPEYIAKIKYPETSRKAIKFVDLR